MNLILQAIKALLRKAEKRFDDAINAPAQASVGQVLAVKAVDGNGKPTEWEAVDVAQLIEGSYTVAEEAMF